MPEPKSATASPPNTLEKNTAALSENLGLFFDPSRLNPPAKMPHMTLTFQEPKFVGEPGTVGYRFVELKTENLKLNQGLNIVPRTTVLRAKENFLEYFAHGAIQEIELGDALSEGANPALKNLSSLSPEQATRTVALERDRASLNAWLTLEARPQVTQAINRRVSELSKGAEI